MTVEKKGVVGVIVGKALYTGAIPFWRRPSVQRGSIEQLPVRQAGKLFKNARMQARKNRSVRRVRNTSNEEICRATGAEGIFSTARGQLADRVV